jgi:hypothetical protein
MLRPRAHRFAPLAPLARARREDTKAQAPIARRDDKDKERRPQGCKGVGARGPKASERLREHRPPAALERADSRSNWPLAL